MKLEDGRPFLYQWDTGRKLIIDEPCSKVSFTNSVSKTLDVEVRDGVALIPDELLQVSFPLQCWAFVGTPETGYTRKHESFQVYARPKPADYVFTPTEQTTLADLIDRIEATENPERIKTEVENYLTENPVEAPVASVNGKTGEVKLNAADVGALAQSALPSAIDTALAQAKASGEFDGKDGKDGADGEVGPVGPAGKDGSPGKDGEDGKTAYEYAKEGGFVGTEAEFAKQLARELPTKLSELENDKGYLTSYTETDPTVPSWAKATSKPSYSKSEVGLGNVDNVKQYSASNPPPYPVKSVNGKTGAVSLKAADVGADASGTAATAVSNHNTSDAAHNDIRLLISGLTARLDALANSDDTTLDQMAEVVAYIKDNRDLIEQITTGKVDVSDIVNNLTTNASNKPLSAAQGVALKSLIDGLDTALDGKLATSELTNAINTALAQAKASGEFNGADGAPGAAGKDGTSVTVKSVSESSADGGNNVVTFSDGKTLTVKNGSKGSKGDTGADGAKGDTGDSGKTAYEYAKDGGYTGTEAEFAEKLANEYTLNPLWGKKISLVGDSICAGSSESTSYLGGYGKIIAERNNMAYENLAKAGSTVTAETYSSTTGAAKGWICRMVANMSSDADYAIVEGGYNDAWQYVDHNNIEIGEISDGYNAVLDDTTYYGAFESMLKQLVTKFQGKKIGYIAVPKMMDRFDSNRNAPNFYHIALECCAKWGVPVCDLNTVIPPFEYLKTLGTDYTADGSHPTYEGYIKYYCDPIEAWMKTLTTGGSLPTGTLPTDLDDKYVSKNDISIKKAQLTLGDGTTVLIDVVVASEGTTIQKYKNLIPTSIDADGNIYNGVGYKEGTRLSSSGAEKTSGYSYAFGYMPAKGSDVVRIFGCGWGTDLNASNYICAYDSGFNFIGAKSTNTTSGKTLTTYSTDILESFDWAENGDTTLTLKALENVAYIRVSSRGATNEAADTFDPDDAIVTINEEIV